MQIEQWLSVKNREIRVTLEFPTVADEQAEEIFVSYLKSIYLEKNEFLRLQQEDKTMQHYGAEGR